MTDRTLRDLEPPVHLSKKSQRLCTEVVPRRTCSAERPALLQVALEALDRAAETIGREGLTVKTTTSGAIHVHPLVRVERESGNYSRNLGATELELVLQARRRHEMAARSHLELTEVIDYA